MTSTDLQTMKTTTTIIITTAATTTTATTTTTTTKQKNNNDSNHKNNKNNNNNDSNNNNNHNNDDDDDNNISNFQTAEMNTFLSYLFRDSGRHGGLLNFGVFILIVLGHLNIQQPLLPIKARERPERERESSTSHYEDTFR